MWNHADEEEKEVFKEARKLGNEKLEDLGKLQERKDERKPQSGGDYENGEERA
jgi:hypothetical protein